jgi:tetratricopeptide (TPR) repeat protein
MAAAAQAKSILSGRPVAGRVLATCLVIFVLVVPQVHSQAQTAARQKDSALGERYRREGIALLEQHKINEALARFRAAVEVNPADAASQDFIGVILSDQGLAADAIAAFEKAVRSDADLCPAHYHLASLYARTGRTAEAIE